jgi:EamA domain-containing membrane protein RarD
VLLALTVLRERLTRVQVVGVVLALAASAALAFG